MIIFAKESINHRCCDYKYSKCAIISDGLHLSGQNGLNLNPHLHILSIDGVYTRYGDVARFRNIEPITDDDVASLVEGIATRVQSLCIRRGYLDKDGDIVPHPVLDPFFQDHESLTAALAASISGKIAFGPNTGNYVRKIGGGFGVVRDAGPNLQSRRNQVPAMRRGSSQSLHRH